MERIRFEQAAVRVGGKIYERLMALDTNDSNVQVKKAPPLIR
jgi:hypothetical protein